MSNYPDFSNYGYQIQKQLKRNPEGGRITYLATAVNLNQSVAIEEYRFAVIDPNLPSFKVYQREIKQLLLLANPRIPRYIDAFPTPQGFCLVRDYKNAFSLAEKNQFIGEEIYSIAISALEILLDLQTRTPPVIHGNISTDSLLVDENLNVYLVNFSVLNIKNDKIVSNRETSENPGFTPPEKFYNRPLTEASDLYSLGATLICLVAGIKAEEIERLIDDNYQFNFAAIAALIQTRFNKKMPSFTAWLEKMVAPNLKDRFENATTALQALKLISVSSEPEEVENRKKQGNRRIPYKILGVALIIAIAMPGAILTYFWLNNPVRKLLSTRECQGCDLQNAKLGHAKLEGANLRGANLQGADLTYASLQGASLQGANLDGADLEKASLQNASLEGASLKSANLESANLEGAFLKGAYLKGANLYKTHFYVARLEGADLVGAERLKDAILTGAFLKGANLEGADLEGANLEGANLQEANLKGANLKRTNLVVANFWGAKLESVNLEDAMLMRASLEFANLEKANLEGANLQCAYLSGAGWKGAILPDGTKYKQTQRGRR